MRLNFSQPSPQLSPYLTLIKTPTINSVKEFRLYFIGRRSKSHLFTASKTGRLNDQPKSSQEQFIEIVQAQLYGRAVIKAIRDGYIFF
jgi:hypothetical protein